MSHWDQSRKVFQITGADTHKFLQDLITNDLKKAKEGLIYAALLTPQGKFLFDFFVTSYETGFLLDLDGNVAETAISRLTMYKLRADVEIAERELYVNRGIDDMPTGAFQDPRDTAMGWREYSDTKALGDAPNWDKIRVDKVIPKMGVELVPNETYILEAGFERLSGVDFKKGCYVGQEVTARMKHKTSLRKGYGKVKLDASVPIGTEITNDGKAVGRIYTQSDGYGIAYLRFDKIGSKMFADSVLVKYCEPV